MHMNPSCNLYRWAKKSDIHAAHFHLGLISTRLLGETKDSGFPKSWSETFFFHLYQSLILGLLPNIFGNVVKKLLSYFINLSTLFRSPQNFSPDWMGGTSEELMNGYQEM